jgi:hypothetical protein
MIAPPCTPGAGQQNLAGQDLYQGATLTLLFNDGQELPFGSVRGGQFPMRDNEQIKKSLQGKKYGYYVNSTVSRYSCPPDLYPLLWN